MRSSTFPPTWKKRSTYKSWRQPTITIHNIITYMSMHLYYSALLRVNYIPQTINFIGYFLHLLMQAQPIEIVNYPKQVDYYFIQILDIWQSSYRTVGSPSPTAESLIPFINGFGCGNRPTISIWSFNCEYYPATHAYGCKIERKKRTISLSHEDRKVAYLFSKRSCVNILPNLTLKWHSGLPMTPFLS